MLETRVQSEAKTYSDIGREPRIESLQRIITGVSYEEACELGDSLLEFFEAFSDEGVGNETGTSS
jgi:hypothetical protein